MKKQSFIKGAVIISAGGFISKILGAVYRIPLTDFLGGRGMGIYQMVYPLYCILLTVSASGIPTGIARLVSAGGNNGVEREAFRFYGAVGVIGSLIMFVLSEPLAALQGEEAVALCCKMLCPSVFFVSVLSVARGYFQGRGNMYPTAVSEVSEQLIKVAVGCLFAYIFRENLAFAVASTLAAVTISEVISCAGVAAWYVRHRPRSPLYKERRVPLSRVLSYTVPLMFTAIAMPLGQLAESVVAVRLLSSADATALYGVYSGCAVTIINLPASVTYGFAASAVPGISPLAQRGEMRAARDKAFRALGITLLVSAPLAVILALGAEFAVNILFGSLSPAEKRLLCDLVRIMAVSSVTISLGQTSSACLTALGKPVKSALTQWLSSAVRVGLCAALIGFTSLSITGAAIAANCAYFVAAFLNFCYIIREGGGHENNFDRAGRFGRRPDAESENRA